MAERPTDLALIELAIDAARVVADFVRSVVAARHDREQLMTAAAAADELVVTIRALDTGGAAAAHAHAAAIDLGVEAIPTVLRRPDTRSSSSQLREVHARLARVIATLNEARTRAVLEAMRSERPPGP